MYDNDIAYPMGDVVITHPDVVPVYDLTVGYSILHLVHNIVSTWFSSGDPETIKGIIVNSLMSINDDEFKFKSDATITKNNLKVSLDIAASVNNKDFTDEFVNGNILDKFIEEL